MSKSLLLLPARLAKRIVRREDGSLTILALFFFIVMIMIGGLSVDIMVFENDRTRLQNLSDRAVLAASDMEQTVDAETVVRSYFEKAGLEQHIDEITVSSDDANERAVAVRASRPMRTMFMNMTGVEEMTPKANAGAREAVTDVEISLVLDVSGSMNWNTSTGQKKISELKSAAKRFVDKVYSTDDKNRVTMSLVPYSTQVNAGATIFDQLGVQRIHDKSHCAVFRDSDFADADIDLSGAYGHTAHFDPFVAGADPWLRVCRPGSEQEIKAVQNNPDVIKGMIEALDANGNTSIEIGVKWGAALLDPSFRPITEALKTVGQVNENYADRPYDWDRDNTDKFLVVLTDGVNTTQFEIKDPYQTGPSFVYEVSVPGQPISFFSVDTTGFNYVAPKKYWTRAKDLAAFTSDAPFNSIDWSAEFSDTPEGPLIDALTDAGVPLPGIQVRRLDWLEVWDRIPLRHLGESYIKAATGNNTYRNQFYDDARMAVNSGTKDVRLKALCEQLRGDDRGVTIFTIGFEVTDYSASVMEDCAGGPNNFIRVVGDDLEQAFNAIAASITKLKLTQ